MNDPGLLLLPTHRLFRGVPAISSVELAANPNGKFRTRPIGVGPELAGSLWKDISVAGQQNKLAFYTAQDDTWTLALATEAGSQQLAQLAAEHSSDWQGLGVSILRSQRRRS